MKQFVFLCNLLLWSLLPGSLSAQSVEVDSLSSAAKAIRLQRRILDSKVYQITHIGGPLIIIGALTNRKDNSFKNMRNSYIPSFSSHYDDYLQYAPGAILLGLKSFGVEGRSSWGRMLTSDAFAAGIMALTVNGLKSTVKKERPDRSSNNSFPSGHTATAFMMATMLHKEYGTTRSPLYSILGYSIATGTALSRQLNNKHWFSDVLTGAGIGIVSTELGYYLADLIFKEKGIVRKPHRWELGAENAPYSYIGIQMGYGVGERELHLPQGIEIEGMSGVTSSLAGGWFFNQHWAVAGKLTVSQVSPALNNSFFFDSHPEVEPLVDAFETRSMSYATLVGGVEYKVRLVPGLYAGGTLMGGVGWTGSYQVDIRYKGAETSSPLIDCQAHPVPNLDLSIHLMHITARNLAIKLFANYNTGIGKAHYSYYAPGSSTPLIPLSGANRVILHNFNIGAEVAALFWR